MLLENSTFAVMLVFAVVTCCTYVALAVFNPYSVRVRNRIQELHAVKAPGQVPKEIASFTDRLSQWAEWLRGGDRSRVTQRLTRAGIYHPRALARYFSIKLLLTAAPPLLFVCLGMAHYLRMDRALVVGCLAGGFGSLAPSLWLDRTIARRQQSLRKALPDFLDLMVVCLEGGMSAQEAMRRVGDELRTVHSDLAMELSAVQRDIELGATLDQALKRFATRTEHEGIRSLSTFIRESQRFGTNITEALRNHSDMLRSQREQLAEERAQKASVKILIPTMLLIFPAIFIVMVGPAAIQIYAGFSEK